VVNGSVSFALSAVDSAAKFIAPSVFNIAYQTDNVTSSLLPPFFIADVQWNATSNIKAISVIAVGVGTAPLVFTGSAINVIVSPVCLPGQFVNLGSLDFLHNESLIFDYVITNNSSLCIGCPLGTASNQELMRCLTCTAGTFAEDNNTVCLPCVGNTWSNAGTQSACLPCLPGFVAATAHDKCISLVFSAPPPVTLTSLTPFDLPPVIAVDNFNRPVRVNGVVSLSLSCVLSDCSAVRKGTMLQATGSFRNGSVLFDRQVTFDESDSAIGSGYSWVLESSSLSEVLPLNSVTLSVSTLQSNTTSLLGPLPLVRDVAPLIVPFSGNVSISITSTVWNVLSRMKPLVLDRTAACRFALWERDRDRPMLNVTIYTGEARPSPGGIENTRICVVPEAPPLSVWNVSVILADGRSSSNSIQIDVVCPHSYYLQNKSCMPCPSDENGRSFNEVNNAPSIESCRCSPGSYGTFGSGCMRCAPLEGFDCSLPDQAVPIIRPGYYGDYSLLPSCGWKSQACAALQTCPFGSRACPGGGDKLCTDTEGECYTGRACTQCCSMFYLENSICNKCPDASTSNTILAAMAAVACGVALVLALSSSPSFTQSIKYFILGMNFFQNLVSIKLIRIDWPVEMLQMFNVLSFFSFSIGAVRPECSFSWNYEYKMIFSLLLPLIASIMIGSVGIGYGVIACRRLFKKIQDLKSKGAKLRHMSFPSLVSCWLHVLFFRPVRWKPDSLMWFALSPYLESRALGSSPKSAPENWNALRTALKETFFKQRVVRALQRSRKIFPMNFELYDVKNMQSILHDAELDTTFASMVLKGRKFASGIFSIVVLFFVGSLTASIGALICEARDDSVYLVQDPTVECNYSSPRYNTMVAIAVSALFLYVIVVPVFLVILLRSQWSQDMRAGDRNGYDALFGFLTSRYSLTCYMWESVMFVYKGLCVMIPAVYSRSPIAQSVSLLFVSLAYVMLLFRFSPFANSLMNAVEKSAALSIFLMYFIAVMFVCEVDGKPILDKTQKAVVAFFLMAICGASALFCFLSGIYEYFFTLLFHGDMFVSKWMRAFQSAIGDSLNEGLFLHFYAFYNPKSRKSLVEKKRILNESIAALMAVKHSEAWKTGSLWLRFKLFFSTLWRWIRFGVKNRNLAECQPMVVHEALQYPEARLFQRLSKIMHHYQHQTAHQASQSPQPHEIDPVYGDEKHTSSLRNLFALCWRAFTLQLNRKCDSKTASDHPAQTKLSTLDPPADFLVTFSAKYDFLSNVFPPESLGILATIAVFDKPQDMGDSSEAQAYVQHMKSEFEALQKSLRAVYSVAREVIEEEERVQQTERWAVRQLKRVLLGQEGACLFRFNMFSPRDLGDLFGEHDFDDFSKDEMLVIPVPQLLAAQLQIDKQQKSLRSFLQKSRLKLSIADASRAMVAQVKAKPVLHQTLFLKAEAPRSDRTGFASIPKRMKLQSFSTMQSQSRDDRGNPIDTAHISAQAPITGIRSILMKRMQTKRELLKNASASRDGRSIRGDAILAYSRELNSGDESTAKRDITGSESVISVALASDCIWVSQAQAFSNELLELKSIYQQHDSEEDAKLVSLVKKIEENASLLALSAAREVKTRFTLAKMTEELKNLRGMARSLQFSKESEIVRLREQYSYDISLKDAELRSKDYELKFFDDSLQSFRAAIKSEVTESHVWSDSDFSWRSLCEVLIRASRVSVNVKHTQGASTSAIAASDTDWRVQQEYLEVKPATVVHTLLKQELCAEVEAADAATLKSVDMMVASAAAPEMPQADVQIAFRSGQESHGVKQRGTGVERL
jgi:hypothetical protein